MTTTATHYHRYPDGSMLVDELALHKISHFFFTPHLVDPFYAVRFGHTHTYTDKALFLSLSQKNTQAKCTDTSTEEKKQDKWEE